MKNSLLNILRNTWHYWRTEEIWRSRRVLYFKGTVPRFSTSSLIKMLFFCRDMLYRLCKQCDHVIMLSKNQSAHSPGSHLLKLCAHSCKFINHDHQPFVICSAMLVLFHTTSRSSEIYFYFEIHSEMAEIHVSGIIDRHYYTF